MSAPRFLGAPPPTQYRVNLTEDQLLALAGTARVRLGELDNDGFSETFDGEAEALRRSIAAFERRIQTIANSRGYGGAA